jgi:hypothetical protein
VPVGRQKAFKIFEDTIDAGTSKDFDSTPLAEFESADYLIKVKNSALGKFKTLRMSAVKEGTDVIDQVYTKNGIEPAIKANILKVGSDVVLRIENDETFVVSAHIVKTLQQ